MEKVNELLVARMRNAAYSFKSSILFYPAALSAASILLFLVTSRIDQTLNDVRFDLPVIESLLFAGSPNAARSVLSTIATGWATVLSVAFSVTLIALQLSVTRHTSEIVNEFENDKINQLTLGWFIATVLYTLLVLKTVRTGENGIDPFTPIIGVNVSVLFAIVALFIFTSYLHNIGSYIKTRTLIDRITCRTIKSLSQFKDRRVDRIEVFADRPSNQDSITEISSSQEGFLRHIDWDKMSKEMSRHGLCAKIRIDWLIAVGDWVGKDSAMAVVYNLGKDSTDKKSDNSDDNSSYADKIRHVIVSSFVIGQKRNLSSDPMYGLEVLRNIAMKARNQSDINSIESCVSGIFKILFEVMKNRDVIGLPFYLPNKLQRDADSDTTTILVIPKADNIADTIFLELSNIYISCRSSKDLAAIIRQFAEEYSTWGMNLLDKGKTEAFRELTSWYSNCIKTAHPQLSLPDNDGKKGQKKKEIDDKIVDVLYNFRKELYSRHPYAVDTFDIYMRAHPASTEA